MKSVTCDNCTNEIILSEDIIIETDIDGIEVKYFECLECTEKYIISCIDDYIRKEQRRYFKLKQEAGRSDDAIKCLNNMKLHSDRIKLKVKDKL